MNRVVLAAYRRKGEENFIFPNLVVGVVSTIEDCNNIAQNFADNNPDLDRISWDYKLGE